jgi:hypothetical protein
VDQSGSICSGTTCSGLLCCSNYVASAQFVIETVKGVQNVTNGTYGFVKFATNGVIVTSLTSPANVTSLVNTTAYSGGWTNTAQAFSQCQTVLGNDGTRILVMLTDGNPTACNGATNCSSTCPSSGSTCTASATTLASNQAKLARDNNITVISVGVGTGITYSNLLNWSGNDPLLVLNVTDFTQLNSRIAKLVETITCVR